MAFAPGLARRLADDVEVDDRLAGGQHLLEGRLDVVRHGGEHLAHGAAEMVDRRHAVDLGQRVVDAHVAELGVEEALADRRRRHERVEQRLRLARRALLGARLAVQARVVDRQRGARGDLAHEGDVVLAVARAPARAHEGDRAQHLLARAQGDDQRRAEVQRAHELEVLGIAGPGHDLLLGHGGEELRLARAHHVRRAGGGVRVGRIALAHAVREGDLGGVGVRHGDVAQCLLAAGHVDRAPVGQVAHAQLGDRGQRAVHLQRGVERGAHVGQEPHARQRGALGVDLARDADDRPARAVDDEPPARVEPVHAAVVPHHAQAARGGGAVGRRGGDRRVQAGAVVGVYALEEGLERGGRLAGAGEGRRRARPVHLATRDVQVEHHGASGLQDERELVPAEVMRCACGPRRHRLAGP